MDKLTLSTTDTSDNTTTSVSKEFETMFVEDFFETVLQAYSAMGYRNSVEVTIHNPILGDKVLRYDREDYISVEDFDSDI